MDIELIRKHASIEVGRRFLEERDPLEDPLDCIQFDKVAAVEDVDLLKVASRLATDDSPVLEVYEALGGKYKTAFGSPMFQMNPIQAPGPAPSPGGAAAPGAAAMKPAMPVMKPGAAGKPGMPGAAGAGGGQTNPMQQASTPKIPGTSGQGQ